MALQKMRFDEEKVKKITASIGTHADFPKQGIIFKDVFTILRDPPLFSDVISIMEDVLIANAPPPTVIVGLDSRGFLFGPILALRLMIPFVPVRKAGKLPGKTRKLTYDLEYGTDSVEIQEGAICDNAKVAVVDDLIATGGTMVAACELIETFNAKVCVCLVVIELMDLKGRNKIKAPLMSITQF